MSVVRKLLTFLFVILLRFIDDCHGDDVFEERVCIGTKGRMSVPVNRDHHHRNLRERYTNCTYVDGNLELTWLKDENFSLSFLQDIREVTGYVLISHVEIKKIALPSLQIIRGRTFFKLNVHDEEFSLLVTHNLMQTLELPSLRDILAGSVGVINNFNLCHVKDIRWEEIITGTKANFMHIYNFSNSVPQCPACHESCKRGCWGEGPENCQKFSKIDCSEQCYQGRCFGPEPRDCCHLFCAGGCTGPKQGDCLACRNFYDDGVCKQECPQMQRYNSVTYSWESNPDGKYAYGATCVKHCPDHLLKDNGACVRFCPPKKKAVNGECVPCDGPCPKTCQGTDAVHAGNINSFKDCTVIEGSLKILQSSFQGFQDVLSNFTFGQRYPPMAPHKLEVFSTLKEVTGYIDIQAMHPNFTDLHYFRNLEVIGGRQLAEYFSALYIVKTSLRSLGLRSLRLIRSGSVVILENSKLCFAQNVNWTKIIRTREQNTLLQNNSPDKDCLNDKLVCNDQCSREGCWGSSQTECLSCQNYVLGDKCVNDCDAPLLYKASDNVCEYCHEECDESCHGPGHTNCTKCKNVRDGLYCVPQCSETKYTDNGECLPCHRNCINGCTGPGNFVGQGGCRTCDKIILNNTSSSTFPHCLKAEEPCPDGFFSDPVDRLQENGPMTTLAEKYICRKCHPRCKVCTGFGFHLNVCSVCNQYRSGEQCEDRCHDEQYTDDETMTCTECASECRKCYGPEIHQCKFCRNFRVPVDGNLTIFNCSATCPPDKPFRLLMEETGDRYCSAVGPVVMTAAIMSNVRIFVIVCGVLGSLTIIGIIFAVFGYQWWQRAKSKENAIKMTMRMSGLEDSEPLKPSNVKPNLAQLRIVKEAELRRGGILGYGAFGVVYKGVWVPEGENIKIPVAIKVLREGTGTNTNKEILEEAYIMASVEHPNLLKLLAVCMTSQMMLVTQLMPLGCLLDYVRNNKDKIGSKPLLNWCTQIAKGMAYLEEKRLVHRDLAARNVLVQTPGCVKITDFGLAKLLDINEDEYKAAGGKMPIKWLALECIQHRRFTHKSDVWAFGVTVWELLTYGARPYENVPAREVPDLLEKGERLPQPCICTIDVYMIMIKCWMLDAESRPSFRELAEEFAKMARDPGRYLVIHGDKLMRLPTYSPQDEKELLRTLSVTDGPEIIMDAEEYLQPKPMNGTPLTGNSTTDGSSSPNSQIKSIAPSLYGGSNHAGTLNSNNGHGHYPGNVFPSGTNVVGNPHYPYHQYQHRSNPSRPDRKYAHLEAAAEAAANSPNLHSRENSLNSRYSSDPVKLLGKGKDPETDIESLGNGTPSFAKREINPNDKMTTAVPPPSWPPLVLPVDEEDYLMPSPGPNKPSTMYMDLIGDSRIADTPEGRSRDSLWHVPDFVPVTNKNQQMLGLDNPEYHAMNDASKQQHVKPIMTEVPPPSYNQAMKVMAMNGLPNHVVPRRKNTSSEEDSDHEYYNDLQREMQPLNTHSGRRSETTV